MLKNVLRCCIALAFIGFSAGKTEGQRATFAPDQSFKTDSKSDPQPILNSLKDAVYRHNSNLGASRSTFESFEGDFLPECWKSIDANGDGQNWFHYGVPGTAFDGTFSAASASWTGATGPLSPDNYLISPKILVEAGDDLLWHIAAQDPAYAEETYGVFLSTTGNNAADFTVQLFQETLTDNMWLQRSVNMAAYVGQEVYIAWRHYNVTDMFYIKLDAITLPGSTLPCFDCSTIEFPEITEEEITCSNDNTGWIYNLTVAGSPGGAFTLSNSANATTIAISGAGTFQMGPFTNGQNVTFTITSDVEASCSVSGAAVANCTDPCPIFAQGFGPWTDLNTAGIPVPDANGNCTTTTITEFEAWAGEAYALNNLPAGVIYQFNICNGPNAGAWPVTFTVLDAGQNIIASGTDGDGCTITWETPAAGNYRIIITRIGYCGIGFQIDNGYPEITCLGLVNTNNAEKYHMAVYPNPVNDQLTVVTALTGNAQVRIFDAFGKLVYAKNQVINGLNTISVNELSTGLYTIQIMSSEGVSVSKFMKQ